MANDAVNKLIEWGAAGTGSDRVRTTPTLATFGC
jgi:hypothetical protein